MVAKIRINTKNGKLAEVEFSVDEFNNYYLINSSNVENIFVDYEQSKEQGFIEVMDIDIKNL